MKKNLHILALLSRGILPCMLLCTQSSSASSEYLTAVTGSPFAAASDPYYVSYSPDNKWLAVANYNDEISMYPVDQTTGALGTSSNTLLSDVFPVNFSPFINGAYYLAAGKYSSPGAVYIYSVNPSTGALTTVGSPVACGNDPYWIAYSPNGQWLATANSGGSGSVSIFSVNQSNGEITPGTTPTISISGAFPYSLAFSADSKWLAVAGSSNNTLYIYSVDDNFSAVQNYSTGAVYPYTVNYSPDGKWLATAGYGYNLLVYAVNQDGTLNPIETYSIPSIEYSYGLQYSPDSTHLAAVDYDDSNVAVFSVNANGTLTVDPNSPYSTGVGAYDPWGCSFSWLPNNNVWFAVGNYDSDNVSVFKVAYTPSTQSYNGNNLFTLALQKKYEPRLPAYQ